MQSSSNSSSVAAGDIVKKNSSSGLPSAVASSGGPISKIQFAAPNCQVVSYYGDAECSPLIDDHFNKSLNSTKPAKTIEQYKSFPASFWNRNYFKQHRQYHQPQITTSQFHQMPPPCLPSTSRGPNAGGGGPVPSAYRQEFAMNAHSSPYPPHPYGSYVDNYSQLQLSTMLRQQPLQPSPSQPVPWSPYGSFASRLNPTYSSLLNLPPPPSAPVTGQPASKFVPPSGAQPPLYIPGSEHFHQPPMPSYSFAAGLEAAAAAGGLEGQKDLYWF